MIATTPTYGRSHYCYGTCSCNIIFTNIHAPSWRDDWEAAKRLTAKQIKRLFLATLQKAYRLTAWAPTTPPPELTLIPLPLPLKRRREIRHRNGFRNFHRMRWR